MPQEQKRRDWRRLLSVTGLLGCLLFVWGYWMPPETGRAVQLPEPVVDPAVLRALTSPGDAPLSVIVVLRDPGGADPVQIAGAQAGNQARQTLVSGLQAQYDRARQEVEPLLEAAADRGEILRRRDLWIINAVALTARPAAIRALMTTSAVAEVRLDQERLYQLPPEGERKIAAAGEEDAWGVAQVRAPDVWHSLVISGTDVVVAGMDSGVDWQHPVLKENYRGYLGRGLVQHTGSWFDAVNESLYPYDDNGHGTHTVGTAVGREEIGVAPGARWIGVKVLSGDGRGYDSDIHAGFQWLLAPDGDPELAPDVVICSWGSTNALITTFAPDIATLQSAGIFLVFAAGNEGPWSGTLRSPASLPGVFAVGASDPDDDVARFSSRGPSPWGEVKPYVVAPGVATWSSMPGGGYAFKDGTSMATPHVAGIAALLREVSPTLPVARLSHVLTQTAVPLSTTVPNNESGWGRVDAYAAVVTLLRPGVVSGTVRSSGGAGLADAVVRAAPHGAGNPAQTVVDAAGQYQLALTPGAYDLTASAFAYADAHVYNVQPVTDTVQQVDFSLSPLPTGVLEGRVTVSPGGAPPTHPLTLRLPGTPLTTTPDVNGDYAFTLPAGDYVLEAWGNGYRVVTESATVAVGETTVRDLSLQPAPTLLLVDEGAWYYGSEISYWREALDGLAYAYDELRLKHPPLDPGANFDEDVVLWSSPSGSPGLVSAGEVLSDYLGTGGHLLLSGQDAAFYDSGQSTLILPQWYLREQMGVTFVKDNAASRNLIGYGPFDGITTTIKGGEGADNQAYPDVVDVRDAGVADSFWRYVGDGSAGIGAHICVPYRALHFGFGLEAVATVEDREAVLAQSLEWLTAPAPTSGLDLTSVPGTRIAPAGTPVTHTFTVRHVGQAGPPDDVAVSLAGNRWPTTITPTTMHLSPCTSQRFTVTVDIPADAGVNVRDDVTVTLASALVSDPPTLTLHTKTPAPLLLVEDDRWYPMEAYYKTTLEALGVPYDMWDTDLHQAGVPRTGELLTDTLMHYPIVAWFTGYDWYAPVTEEEEGRLLHYLDHGGRLLLSSQDFLYFDAELRPLGARMGVQAYVYDRTTERAFGVSEHPAGGSWGPVDLEYPFRNWSDFIEPAPGAAPVVRDATGGVTALAQAAASAGAWRTLFYGFPLESLPAPERKAAFDAGLGWLSPLGTSAWSVTPSTPLSGETVTATAVLRNDDAVTQPVQLSHTLPASLTLVAPPPEASYDPGTRTLSWSGDVEAGGAVTLTWQATAAAGLSAGTAISPRVALGLPAWGLTFTRASALRIAGADLSSSQWRSSGVVHVEEPLTLTFALHNDGAGALVDGRVRFWLSPGLAPVTATVPPTVGIALSGWGGGLPPGATQELTVAVRPWRAEPPVRIDALLDDGTGRRWERAYWPNVVTHDVYLPLVYKNAP